LPAETLARLRAALPAGTLWATDLAAVPADRFLVLAGTGEAGPGRYTFRVDAADQRDEVEAALAEAWLHGVTVDWTQVAPGAGRRVPAPTYPFTRSRYWALDRLSLAPHVQATTPQVAGPPEEVSADDVEATLQAIWRDLFGTPSIGLDDTFGALGGTSLL